MKRIYLAAAAGLLALLSMSPAALRAATIDTPITFTVNEPVSIENTVLVPGTYLVKPVDGQSSAVMIFDQSKKHLIETCLFTNVVRRPGSDASGFSLYETAPGSVPALRDIFAKGEDLGIEFSAPR
ncbi:MAG TPA: hypothetical protein VH325_00260 [Bryobacteraceae bacterium]|jgi:hypothetical protein|nr:hypothetical protein [Bryobacteraceae bacterium]